MEEKQPIKKSQTIKQLKESLPSLLPYEASISLLVAGQLVDCTLEAIQQKLSAPQCLPTRDTIFLTKVIAHLLKNDTLDSISIGDLTDVMVNQLQSSVIHLNSESTELTLETGKLQEAIQSVTKNASAIIEQRKLHKSERSRRLTMPLGSLDDSPDTSPNTSLLVPTSDQTESPSSSLFTASKKQQDERGYEGFSSKLAKASLNVSGKEFSEILQEFTSLVETTFNKALTPHKENKEMLLMLLKDFQRRQAPSAKDKHDLVGKLSSAIDCAGSFYYGIVDSKEDLKLNVGRNGKSGLFAGHVHTLQQEIATLPVNRFTFSHATAACLRQVDSHSKSLSLHFSNEKAYEDFRRDNEELFQQLGKNGATLSYTNNTTTTKESVKGTYNVKIQCPAKSTKQAPFFSSLRESLPSKHLKEKSRNSGTTHPKGPHTSSLDQNKKIRSISIG